MPDIPSPRSSSCRPPSPTTLIHYKPHPTPFIHDDYALPLITLPRNNGNCTSSMKLATDNNTAEFSLGTINNKADYAAASIYNWPHKAHRAGHIGRLTAH